MLIKLGIIKNRMISKEKARLNVPDRKSLYTSLLRNGHILPKLKDPLMSNKFMTGILHNKFWSLTTDKMIQGNYRISADPPPRKEIAKMLSEALVKPQRLEETKHDLALQKAIKRTAKRIAKTVPNKEWMLTVLSQFEPDNEIF